VCVYIVCVCIVCEYYVLLSYVVIVCEYDVCLLCAIIMWYYSVWYACCMLVSHGIIAHYLYGMIVVYYCVPLLCVIHGGDYCTCVLCLSSVCD